MNVLHVRPNHIRIEASSFCQLRCPSCPTTSGAIHPAVGSGFLRAADFERLLADNPDLQSVELSNYGEIFLNPELSAILEIAHRRGVGVRALNGVNLNTVREETLEAVVKYGLTAMTCSIDGATNETYKKYRVRGDFDQVIANIRRINDFKRRYATEHPRLVWQFIVFGHNQHEVEAARTMAADLGMEFAPKLTWDEALSPADPDLLRGLFGVADRDEHRAQEGQDYVQFICRQLWQSPQINWDGKMLGCCRNFWGDFGSNVFRDGLKAAVNSPRMRHARRMLRGRAEPREDVPCTTCDIYLDMAATRRFVSLREVATMRARQIARRVLTLGRAALGGPVHRVKNFGGPPHPIG